ncbi:probable E3 ubiquitin-protein ligase HIP1 isoform X2 [Typha latifolia]|uniref:probable E3 ubiquitin-protein ligase HIP1 isoform X2 n=1 Tax=Typha latifolia TaxID=4733 RepID=UPI003C300694
MQGQRSNSHPHSGTHNYAVGSSSNTTPVDQHNLLLNPVNAENLPGYLLPPGDNDMLYRNLISQENVRLNIWNSDGSSSAEHTVNEGCNDETKREHMWSSSLANNRRVGPRIEGRQSEATNLQSPENVNLNLNISQIDHGQPSSETWNLERNVENVDIISQDLGLGLSPALHNTGLVLPEHVHSSDASSHMYGSTSTGFDFFPRDARGRQLDLLNDHRLSCKRKSIDGIHGESSTSGSSSHLHQSENRLLSAASHSAIPNLNSSSSSNTIGLLPPVEQLNTRTGTTAGLAGSDHHSVASAPGSAESFLRNTRMRIMPQLNDTALPNILPQGSIGHSNYCPSHQPSPGPILGHQSDESGLLSNGASSHRQPLLIPDLSRNLQPFPPNGTSNSGIAPMNIAGEGAILEESNLWSTLRSNFSEHLACFPPTNTSHVVQGSTNWHLTGGNRSLHGSSGSALHSDVSVGNRQPLGSVSRHSHPSQYHRNIADIVRRSLSSSGASNSRRQSVPLQRRGHHPTSHEFGGHHSGVGYRTHPQPYLGSALLADRQSGGQFAVPLAIRTPTASREGRSRMLSEMRNVLDLLRRGENIRFEDLFIFDQAGFFGAPYLQDRHRDMRLDVDNMSYEELLALEEQIGNVNTGLSEETIIKCLKQRKYISITLEPLEEVEPCSICQEEYVDGEELGRLDCGHDFHTDCIKQWLMLKNLCPICKTTALSTEKQNAGSYPSQL